MNPGFGLQGNHLVEVSEECLNRLLRSLLVYVDVDEDWYRKTYKDTDDAISAGVTGSAHEHYVKAGYFEDRIPQNFKVDENWYLDAYPDVRIAIKTGSVKSATNHFYTNGFKEGRFPYKGWSILEKKQASVGSK